MWQKTVAAALVLCGAQGFGYALCQEMKCMLYHDTEQKQMLLYMTREIAFLHRPIQEILEQIGEKLQEPYRTSLRKVVRTHVLIMIIAVVMKTITRKILIWVFIR